MILNTYEIYTNSGTFIDALAIFAVVIIIVSAIFGVFSLVVEDYGFALGALVAAILSAGYVWIVSDYITEKHTEYEVIVEDYNEIHEQGYEIVEQRGDITVIKEAGK